MLAKYMYDTLLEEEERPSSTRRYTGTDTRSLALNKRALLGTLKMFLWRAKSDGEALSIVYVDINHLKDFNEAFGREAGDDLLKKTVQAIRQNIRNSDVVGRIAGDEFVVLMHDCEREVAEHRLRQAAQELRALLPSERKNKGTFKVGCIETKGAEGNGLDTLEKLIQMAKEKSKKRH